MGVALLSSLGLVLTQQEEMDEAEAERQNMLKGMFPGMKALMLQSSHLQTKYGAFPSFWQDLGAWPALKAMQKTYLMVCEQRERGVPEAEIDIEGIDRRTAAGVVGASNAGADFEEAGEMTGLDPYEARPGSKWEPRRADGLPNIPGITRPAELPEELQHELSKLQRQLDNVERKITTVVEDAKVMEQDLNRPPSPPPIYDAWGKRTNTREVRMKEDLERERGDIVARLVKIDVTFKPAQAVIGGNGKPMAKVFVPVEEFPHYNFIGLILGPRGNTQRRLEGETGCKISIRGKGSVKEGSRGRNTKTVEAAEAEPLHVVITGETRENVDLAVKKVEELLQVKEDMDNSHKQNQLRELALINGTLREDEFCSNCGEQGHRQYECPHRNKVASLLPTNIRCSICGEPSHPTSDCPLKKGTGASGEIDAQYQSFMAELDGGGQASSSSSSSEEWKPNKQARVEPAPPSVIQSQERVANISRSAGRGKTILPAWMTENGGQGAAAATAAAAATITTTASTAAPSAASYGAQSQEQQQYASQYQYGAQQQQQYVDPQQYYQAYGSDPNAHAYGYSYDQQAYAQQQGYGYDYSAYQNQQAYYGTGYDAQQYHHHQQQQYAAQGQPQAPPPPPPPPPPK